MSHHFSVDVRIPAWDPTVIQQYRKEFNQFDVNKDGSLDKKEFIEWMKSTGSQAKVAKNIFEVVDRDGNECINFEEFATFAAACSEMVQNNDMNSYLTLLFKAAVLPDNRRRFERCTQKVWVFELFSIFCMYFFLCIEKNKKKSKLNVKKKVFKFFKNEIEFFSFLFKVYK
ncbi:hypothetical protein TRFO_35414 [Tritrichomonas foetus]|uniref:EF-hand domain-containing protein n=1 Tax=Tritrichomonas foetus TaxID=1144522 RepID=A0A1J4JHM0_9EUKA|nr:hypothetical protein TRFO_35414 [Tritrichomonas foetus]|eukprot:OHS98217.1 hypothetical protein TRFO_35414 [Tritrichomonas foetus]